MLLKKPDRERGFKKERIIRVLLNHSNGELTKYRVAKLAEVSEPWCREFTGRLEDEGLLDDTKALNPRALYEEWRRIRIKPNQLSVSLQRPRQLLVNTKLDYALTTYQAENLQQGFLFPSTVDFYVKSGQIENWLEIIKDKGFLGGGNTRLRATDEHVFYNRQKLEGLTTVSTPQLIADLLDEGGPCEEAADKLIRSFHQEGKVKA